MTTKMISIIDLFGSLFINLKLFFIALLLLSNSCEIGALAASTPKNASAPYIVVLDPGHGGSDVGAQNKALLEKDIALAIATRVGRVLKDRKYWAPLGRKVKVIFTREKDVDVSLEARAAVAHENHADLFVSIHCNSEATGTVRGVETYFLNNTDDSSNQKLAQIENKNSKKYKLFY